MTAIEWTDETWNPTTGCDRISAGCDHCYALTLAKRLKAMGQAKYQTDGKPPTSGPGFGLATHPDTLLDPLRWRKPRRIFTNSMSDLFHDQVPDEFIARVFGVMALARRHTFQVLTKRPGRMASLLNRGRFELAVQAEMHRQKWTIPGVEAPAWAWPLPNVWLGTSVENQKWADVRIPKLLDTPAAVRFLSCEPLLGPVALNPEHLGHPWARANAHSHANPRHILGPVEDDDGGWSGHMVCDDDGTGDPFYDDPRGCGFDTTKAGGIDWVIAGGESGPGARPMHPDWARGLRDECQADGVPFFFKQWGEWMPAADLDPDLRERAPEDAEQLVEQEYVVRVGKKYAGRELDGREWNEYPAEAAR